MGLDADKHAIENARRELESLGKELGSDVFVRHGSYTEIQDIKKEKNLGKADGLLLDLGLSSNQLEESGRGFTFMKNEPLDMRYDASDNRNNLTAEKIINGCAEEELADIFWKYGEERKSRQMAKAIVTARKKKRIETTADLLEIIGERRNQKTRIHPATKVFMALRIRVNSEFEHIESIMEQLPSIVKGKTAIISFHSLEDRLIKEGFKRIEKEGWGSIQTKKVIKPSYEEIRENPKSRSAKLRVIQILSSRF